MAFCKGHIVAQNRGKQIERNRYSAKFLGGEYKATLEGTQLRSFQSSPLTPI